MPLSFLFGPLFICHLILELIGMAFNKCGLNTHNFYVDMSHICVGIDLWLVSLQYNVEHFRCYSNVGLLLSCAGLCMGDHMFAFF